MPWSGAHQRQLLCVCRRVPSRTSLAASGFSRSWTPCSRSGHGGVGSNPRSGRGSCFLSLPTPFAEDLMRFSSLAAARARYTHSTSVLQFQPGMKKLLMRSHVLEVEIGKALDRNEFTMLYQPKIDLAIGQGAGSRGADALDTSRVGRCTAVGIHTHRRALRPHPSRLRLQPAHRA